MHQSPATHHAPAATLAKLAASPERGQSASDGRGMDVGPVRYSARMASGAAGGRGAVVITGAGSGIGRACAELLHERGFRVFAGVRRAAALGDCPGLVPLRLDVTDPLAVAAAVAEVSG